MNMRKFIENRYLKASDYPRPAVLTIVQVVEETIGQDENQKEVSVMYFENVEKCLVLNKTAINTMIDLTNSEESDQWIGRAVEIFTDNSVMYKGQRMPALRLRAPQQRAAAAPQRATPQVATPGGPQATANPTNLVTDEFDPDSIPDPGPPMTARQRQAGSRSPF